MCLAARGDRDGTQRSAGHRDRRATPEPPEGLPPAGRVSAEAVVKDRGGRDAASEAQGSSAAPGDKTRTGGKSETDRKRRHRAQSSVTGARHGRAP